jgi:putative membrane protein
MKQYLLTGVAVLAMSVAPAFAQTTSSAKAGGTKAGTMKGDQKFVHNAAAGGMAEVELGKLAQEKGSSEQVKSFGKRMVDDHSKANDELKMIAQKKNITLPTDLDRKDKSLRDRLSKLSGPAFDRAYMRAMLMDHRKDVNEFQHESKAGADPDVKSFAAKTLPTLEDHLKAAQDTDKAVGTSGRK